MTAPDGWIKLHRRILDHPRVRDPDWIAVWIYLLLNAAYAPRKETFNGRVIDLQPGQLVTDRRQIASRTGVHEAKVFRVLACLKSEHQIEHLPGNRSSLVSITNWASYQETEHQFEHEMNTNRTPTEHQTSISTNKIKGFEAPKKGRREEVPLLIPLEGECVSAPDINAQAEEIYRVYPLKVKKPKALAAIKKALRKRIPFDWLLTKTKEFAAIRAGNLAFCPHPSTWFNAAQYNDHPETWHPQDHVSLTDKRNALDEQIKKHTANPESSCYCGSPTPEQRAELKKLRADRDDVINKIARSKA